MKVITIDIRKIYDSGIGTYIQNILPFIITNFPTCKINLIYKKTDEIKFSWVENKIINLIPCRSQIFSISEQFEVIKIIPKDTDLYWSPHYNIPFLYKGKILITVHDVFPLAMPQYLGGFYKYLYAKYMFRLIEKKASRIITVSNFTFSELCKLNKQKSEDIKVIYNGLDSVWFDLSESKNPYDKNYILFVGNVKQNKNIIGLLTAYESIMNKIPQDLIIVGKKEGFITGDTIVKIKAEKLESRVKFIGSVGQKELRDYYKYANLFVFPSLYEGFGLPPLEAMASECPVLASKIPSIEEICADAVCYCNPLDTKDIADKIMLLLSDDFLRKELIEKGKRRAGLYSWEKCAKETCEVMEKLIE